MRLPASATYPTQDPLKTNLDAVAVVQPQVVELLCAAEPPYELTPATGRDGAATFTYCDENGKLHWLGRTTMPIVRAPGLLASFDAGGGNVLLAGVARGDEAAQMLATLPAHQAVFVVEPAAWVLRMALSLHALETAIRLGRLPLFAGASAWEDLERFLRERDGYLTPGRVLAWPWFRPAEIRDVTNRLSAIGAAVAASRERKLVEVRGRCADASKPERTEPVVALLGAGVNPRLSRVADRIAAAVEQQRGTMQRLLPERPDRVHPCAIEGALAAARPDLCICPETNPDELAIRWPATARCALVAHQGAIWPGWAAGLAEDVTIAVSTPAQAESLPAAGVDASRVWVCLPAAHPDVAFVEHRRADGNVLILGDAAPSNAEAAGLAYMSHRRVWEAMRARLMDGVAAGCAVDPEQMLADAERGADAGIGDRQVRAHLVVHVRDVLAPGCLRGACARALRAAGHAVTLLGAGWSADVGADVVAPPVTLDAQWVMDLAGRVGAVVAIEPNGLAPDLLLDLMAAGVPAMVWMDDGSGAGSVVARLVEPGRHVWSFIDPGELVALVARCGAEPAAGEALRRAASEHILQQHTWVHRLDGLLSAVRGVSSVPSLSRYG